MQRQPPSIPISFHRKLLDASLYPLHSLRIETLQINVGKRCNSMCKHCHVEAGPGRTETISRATLEACLAIAREPSIKTIDLTGGSPEMSPHLGWFLDETAKLGKRLMVRSNLMILLEEEYGHFMDIYTRNRVEIAASLPHWKAEMCDRQRGRGSFDRVVAVMKLLNGRGYASPGSGLILDLVHNPVGSFLPGPQAVLENEYKTELATRHHVFFNRLFCLTNNPVGRFKDYLTATDNYDEYMGELLRAFSPCAACNVMCRTALSIGYDGAIYDCDFNQMLGLPVNHGAPNHIERFDLKALERRQIIVNDHCYACTAGQGSSCQGALQKQRAMASVKEKNA
jgi:radical SAM/Cys-rich protein